jgi:hypothetical protein
MHTLVQHNHTNHTASILHSPRQHARSFLHLTKSPRIPPSYNRQISSLTFSGLELLGLRRSANTTSESPERDDLLVLGDVVQVGVRLLEVPACALVSDVRAGFMGQV